MEQYEITCPNCETEYQIAVHGSIKLPRHFKCTMCGHYSRDWTGQPRVLRMFPQHDTSPSPAPQYGVENYGA